MAKRIYYVIAGEVSGDKLGAGMIRELRQRHPDALFFGVGGPLMAAEGLHSLFPYHELALMGFAEILPKLLHLLSRIDAVVEDIELKQPHAVITIDSPGFNFRVVKKLRKHALHSQFIHVVAPTVWAYKEKRAKECAALFDHLLVLLPFEPPYFERVGLPATFIGHPSVAPGQPRGDGESFRTRHHIRPEQKIIALLPGSRENEVKRHMALMTGVIDELVKDYPDLVVVSSAPAHIRPMLSEYFMTSPHRSILSFDAQAKMDSFAAADVALVKSGTVSLEMAYARTPMVVMYKVNALTAAIAKRLIRIPYVSLVNILLNRMAIPELLQENATTAAMTHALKQLLSNPQAAQQQIAYGDQAVAMLQHGSLHPAQQAANVIDALVK